MKLVILDGYTLNPGDLSWEGIAAFGEVVGYDRTAPEETAGRIHDADIVLVNKVKLTREVLAGANNLKFITVLATGYDCVDLGAARERGIIVSNVPAYGTDTVAQYTLALLLELAHQVGRHSESVREGQWERSPDWTYQLSPQIELSGKTLGIIGYGRIGQRVGELAAAFGMKVITLARPGRTPGIPAMALAELLAVSDVVSLHCPLTEETRGIIGRDHLALMKPTAFLLNASRGPLIIEADLKDALERGVIAGAALDVLAEEPMAPDHLLRNVPNLIITPHIAWSTREARIRILEATVENIQSFLDGAPRHRVI